jgi:predicted kinase
MRNLLILVGNQCQGKSTWIEENNLKDFTLSLDTLRLMFKQPVSLPNGKVTTNELVNPEIINVFKNALRYRMSEGAFTVIDAMHIKESDFKLYKKFADKYGYRLWVKDFRSNRSLEDCLSSINDRPTKWIPEEAIIERFELQKNLKLNSSFTFIDKISEINNSKDIEFFDKSEHENIYFIGDIHGCLKELDNFLDSYYNEDDLYVFTGDYIDRGPDSPGVLNRLSDLYDKGNVILIEGNHEKWLRYWSTSNEEDIRSKEFRDKTLPQFNAISNSESGTLVYTKKKGRSFMNKLSIYSSIEFHGKKLFACHGGVSRIDKCHPSYSQFSAHNYISGAGNYSDLVEMYKHNPEGVDYVIHGHRNRGDKFFTSDRYINLEGSVEAGGNLKVVQFSLKEKGVRVTPILINSSYNYYNDGKTAVEELRASVHVKETVLKPHLSSFNFTKELFQKAAWSKTTIRARGLFVNTLDNTVMARSYDKFFNIDEVPETSTESIKEMSYPIDVWEKGNGYLGIVSWDKVENKILISSKSTTLGDFANWFSELLHKLVDVEKLGSILKETNTSAVFEVILPSLDPHIIEYSWDTLILLDVIENSFVFKAWGTKEREDLVKYISLLNNDIQFRSKTLYCKATSYDELTTYFNHFSNAKLEGFVCEDSKGKKFKFKGSYYSTIKLFRGYWDLSRKSDGEAPYTRLISELNRRGFISDTPGFNVVMTKSQAIELAEYVKNNWFKFDNIISLKNGFDEKDW